MKPGHNGRAGPTPVGSDVSFRSILLGYRRVRYLSQEAVPRELLEECVELALLGPSRGTYDLGWELLLVDDAETRRSIGELSRKWAEAEAARQEMPADLIARVSEETGSIGVAPWIVVACDRFDFLPVEHSEAVARYGRIFQAVQNLLLCLHAAGLGARPSTLALNDTPALCRILSLADGVLPCSVIPVGWPAAPRPAR